MEIFHKCIGAVTSAEDDSMRVEYKMRATVFIYSFNFAKKIKEQVYFFLKILYFALLCFGLSHEIKID